MTTDDRDTRADGALAALSGDAAAVLDERIAASRPTPDFAAMMGRARALAAAGDEAALAPEIALGRDGEVDGDEAALAPFTAALRAELDARVEQRGLAGVPAPPPMVARRRRVGVIVGLLAVAAAVLLAVVGPRLAGQAGPSRGAEASAAGGSTTPALARPVQPPPIERVVPAVPEDRPGEAVPEDRPGEAVPEDRPPSRAEGPRKRRSAPEPAPPQPGPSLEDEAQALWQRGELAAAERKFREILAVAGPGRRAELAYGDLFALARQMHGADAQAVVWRAYLGQFPRGQFADDARAGLCQRTAAGERAACWRDYLQHHPDGAHRQQAEAARGGEATP